MRTGYCFHTSLLCGNGVLFQQLSQFWYDDVTIESLVNVALKEVGPDAKIALISCPTLYNKIKQNMSDTGKGCPE